MDWVLGLWIAGIVWSTVIAAVLPLTTWWVGTISGVMLGPFGVLLVAIDVGTYRQGTREASADV